MKMKDTLLLGQTEFPMRGNLPVKEVVYQAEWEQAQVYEQRQTLNESKPTFVLHDGPPYANGAVHMGHAMNKVTKDIIMRSKSMAGYRAPYVPGWDTHGLPIEQALTNAEGVDRKKMSAAAFRKLCAAYAWRQIDEQRSAFKRLGVAGTWDNPYVTLRPEFEAAQVRVFGKMAEKGYIYKGFKPIYWSPSSESSLAEAEIEYQDVESPSLYVAFPVADGKGVVSPESAFVIWTTTPWTLPANLGIAVHADYDYVEVATQQGQFIVAKQLLPQLETLFGWQEVRVLQTMKGADLEHTTARHPFYDRTSLVMVGDHVTLEAGTGLVHTAPGHGEDDFLVSKRYGLPVLSPVDHQGKFTDEAPGFEGQFYATANQPIIELLREKGLLLHLEHFVHSYPHDWRTKKPVIFRATPQWFASIDRFRTQLLEVIANEVTWHHPSGQVRIHNMVRDRGDWVISRQRVWGVPLPIFYAENGEAIITPETIEHVAQLFEQHGSDIWFEWETQQLLPEGFTHPGSPNGVFTQEMDIMDVWFDSGSSHAGVLRLRPELTFPADMYLEGSDQYRGWFNSSLTTSVAVNECAPYRSVLSQGFVVDGEGRKMSKSVGNVISPVDEMKTKGADIIRLWVSSVNYEADVRVSKDILNQVSEVYRKIRNTMRFMLANTSDFDPQKDAVPFEQLRSVDQYLMVKCDQLVQTVREAYDQYQFSVIYQQIINFCTVDLSQFYLDFAKDVLYIEKADSHERRAMQTVIYDVLVRLTKLLTPILVHTCEEVWQYLKEPEAFAQLADFPEPVHVAQAPEILARWAQFHAVRDVVLKALEEARNAKVIGKSFEAHVTLYPSQEVADLLAQLEANVAQLFIVSQLTVMPVGSEVPTTALVGDGVAVTVAPAVGQTCERCRAIQPEVGTLPEAPTLCARCAAIVAEQFPEMLQSLTGEE